MFAQTILILNFIGGFKMKKKLVTVLLASSMVATMLAGCGSGSGDGTEKGSSDRKSTRLNSSHDRQSRMPSSA